MWYKPGELAKVYGVTRQTINNWIRGGEFEKVKKTIGGHQRIWVQGEESIVGYCRVSIKKQEGSLQTQKDIIREKYPDIEIISDIGSGFNSKRRGFISILERCLSGSSVTVVVSTGDRLASGGLPFVKWAIEASGGSVVELEKSDSEETFDTAELVGFITSFIDSYHGKRSAKRSDRNKKS